MSCDSVGVLHEWGCAFFALPDKISESVMSSRCCERLNCCPFFLAVKELGEASDVLNEYVAVYCCGPFKDKCFRLQHLARFGEPPGDNVSPSGLDYREYLHV
ncbi:MAG: hypothetical protein RQ754_01315 [Desulfuromonadales bacterium]|nr:hypothetical protein [Desulfuromonadales bacterium]